MADVYNYIVGTGVIVPDTEVIQSQIQQEYINAFGSDLVITPNSPQGILMATELLARSAVADNNATLANQINPNEAGGVFLDSLLSLLGSSRTSASPSTVLCTLAGIAGTVIPAGAQISDGSNDIYQLVVTTTIPSEGSISNVLFQSVENGPIPGLANSLTTIVSNILGWESVNNPSTAILGSLTQSDIGARAFRLNTLASQGMGFAQAIISAVTGLTSGVSLTFQENYTSTTQVIKEVTMVPHSMYACIGGFGTPTTFSLSGTLSNGSNIITGLTSNSQITIGMSVTGSGIPSDTVVTGLIGETGLTLSNNATSSGVVVLTFYYLVTITDIAEAITNTKNGGCAYNNGRGIPQSVNITNEYSGQVIPVLFDTPSFVNISIIATVHAFTSVQNITTAVQNAILTYAAGGISGSPGFFVGADVSPFQLAGAINILVPGLFVQEIQIAIQSFTQQGTIVSGMNTVTNLTYNTDIAVGMQVFGSNIPSSTTVASLVGSTGLTLSNNSTASATEILTFQPTLAYQTTEILMKVWQQAMTSIPYITVIQV